MAYKCTKRIVEYSFRKRLFCLTEPHLPHIATLKYKRLYTETDGGSGLGFNFGYLSITDVENVKVTFDHKLRIAEPKTFIKNLENGYCLECGDTSKCVAIKYKFK
jgi:hypothetical protein